MTKPSNLLTLAVVVLGLLVGCGDPAEALPCHDEDVSDQPDAGDLEAKAQALQADGCYGYVTIKPAQPPGWTVPSWYDGTVWNRTVRVANECLYQLPGYEYLYSPTTTSCARVDSRTWYCGGLGVVQCPASATLARPHESSDDPFGPYGSFGRYHQSKHAQAVMPFATTRFDTSTGTGRVACIYNAYGTTYKYTPSDF